MTKWKPFAYWEAKDYEKFVRDHDKNEIDRIERNLKKAKMKIFKL